MRQILSPSLSLAVGLTAVLSAQSGSEPAKPASRPNVLLIGVDDLNDWVGVLGGHPQASTPNIDRLAARGTLFANAHCQAPVCAPSRASLATGRLPSTTGMYFLTPALAAEPSLRDTRTLTRRFAEEGYTTMGVGKIHHGNEKPFFGEYGGDMGGFGPLPDEKLVYPLEPRLWDWGPHPATDSEMPDSRVAGWAIDKLQQAHDEPFFLAVGFWRPHVPMYAPAHWFERIPLDDVQLPAVLDTDRLDLPDYAKRLTIGHPAPRHEWFLENDQWRQAIQAYLATSSFVDACVGLVLDALESGPHADDTIVVLFSDHGFHLGEKQRWAKRSLWERSTHVPLIVSAPGFEPGRSNQPVGLVDIYPTLLELCGLNPEPGLDGHSMAPLITDPDRANWPHAAVTTFGPGNHAVRDERWRYIRYADGSEELYDHATDPAEWHNLLAASAESPGDAIREVVETMREHLPTQDAALRKGAERSSGYAAFRDAEEARSRR